MVFGAQPGVSRARGMTSPDREESGHGRLDHAHRRVQRGLDVLSVPEPAAAAMSQSQNPLQLSAALGAV